MSDVLVWAPVPEHARELITAARGLVQATQGKVVALALGDTATQAGQLAAADRVLTAQHELLKGLSVEVYADALHQAVQQIKPRVVLVGSGIRSKDVAARVATRLETGCGSEHVNLRFEDGKLLGERPYYSGNSFVTEKFLREPAVAVVPARAYEPAPASGSAASEPIQLNLQPPKARVSNLEKKAAEGVDLETAPIVVSVGRGVKKKEDLALMEQLAQAMGGTIGCTRPIAADLKWLGDEHWIGLSGHEVKPKAYIGLGVSGQIQHVAGMRGSKLIVAINKDEEAPLVKISDYAVVEDLYKIVPPLIEAVKKVKGA